MLKALLGAAKSGNYRLWLQRAKVIKVVGSNIVTRMFAIPQLLVVTIKNLDVPTTYQQSAESSYIALKFYSDLLFFIAELIATAELRALAGWEEVVQLICRMADRKTRSHGDYWRIFDPKLAATSTNPDQMSQSVS